MPRILISRTEANVEAVRRKGNHRDSRSAAWFAIRKGGEVIRDIQETARKHHDWLSLNDSEPYINEHAGTLLRMRLEAIQRFKNGP